MDSIWCYLVPGETVRRVTMLSGWNRNHRTICGDGGADGGIMENMERSPVKQETKRKIQSCLSPSLPLIPSLRVCPHRWETRTEMRQERPLTSNL